MRSTCVSRPRPRAAILGVGLALLAAGSAAPALGEDRTPFRVGIAAKTTSMVPLWMAEAAGIFRRQGLDVEISSLEGGSRGLRAVMTGDIQAMHVGLSVVVEGNARGGDLRLIASSSNTMRFGFFVTPDVITGADLKGQRVGISSLASESDVASTLALRQLGLERADVTIVEVGGTLARLAAVTAGEIKATPLNEPASSMAERRGLRKLVDLAGTAPWIFSGVVVTQRYLSTHRPVLARFLRAYLEGAYLALSDESWAKQVLAREFATADPAVLDASYADFKRWMPRHAEPSRAGAETVLRELSALGTAVGRANVDDHVDGSLLDELRKDGVLGVLEQKYGAR